MCVAFVTCDVSCGVTVAGMSAVACALVRTFMCVCVRVSHTHSSRTVTLHSENGFVQQTFGLCGMSL